MLQEALEFLWGKMQAQVAATADRKAVPVPGIDNKVFLANPLTGAVEGIDLPAPRRSHEVRTINDLADAVKAFTPGASVVWVGDGLITAVLDDEERRDFVSLRLERTEQFSRIVNLSGKKLSQPQLIHTLRTVLREARGVSELLGIVRSLKFRRTDAGHGDVQHGKESLGRSVEAEVTGAGDFPEEISVSAIVFRDASLESDYERELTFTLTVDVESQAFLLELLPDQASEAIDSTLTAITDRLTEQLSESGARVLCGAFKGK